MFSLEGKKALVCGGGGYVGEPVSAKLAESGTDIVIADRDFKSAGSSAAEISKRFPERRVSGVFMDVSDEESIRKGVKEAAGEFSRIDIMVNLAAAGSGMSTGELTA